MPSVIDIAPSATSGSGPFGPTPKANSAAPNVRYAGTVAQKWHDAAASNCEATARPPLLIRMPCASPMRGDLARRRQPADFVELDAEDIDGSLTPPDRRHPDSVNSLSSAITGTPLRLGTDFGHAAHVAAQHRLLDIAEVEMDRASPA